MYVVLARSADNGFIACGDMSDRMRPASGNKAYTGTSEISKTALASFYNDPSVSGGKKEVNVFIFCNPTEHLVGILGGLKYGDTGWYDSVCSGDNVEIAWRRDSFLMSNYSMASRLLPISMDDWLLYGESNPFNLSGMNNAGSLSQVDNREGGAVRVERAVSRFDFRDGSRFLTGYKPEEANTYPVVRVVDVDGTPGDYIVNVRLNKMALVNMNNSFYYLRRVSKDGLPAGASLCAPEKPWFGIPGDASSSLVGNYIVDPIASQKNLGIGITDLENYFSYPFFTADGKIDNTNNENDRWNTVLLSDILNNDEDNDESWNNGSRNDYRIWRYVTENAIPADADRQTNGVSTGVVFKGKMIATDAAISSTDADTKRLAEILNYKATDLYHDSYKDPIIYMFGGNLYVSWPSIRKAVKAAAYDEESKQWFRSIPLYVAVYGDGGTGEEGDPLERDVNSADYKWNEWNKHGKTPEGNYLSDFRTVATEAGLTIYQSSEDSKDGWGYYCYYYYWNRHNDNELSGQMAPMEFAVVRNNVYKLSVSNISRLGHPRISDNDPDKPTPDTPDERSDIYLTVSVDVLPWVVRINDIEF